MTYNPPLALEERQLQLLSDPIKCVVKSVRSSVREFVLSVMGVLNQESQPHQVYN